MTIRDKLITIRDKLIYPAQILFAILFCWFISQGSLAERAWREGIHSESVRELGKDALPDLLVVAAIIALIYLFANAGGIFGVIVGMASCRNRDEDPRLTRYRTTVIQGNFLGTLRVFCGFLGIGILFILALVSLIEGTKGGLFAGEIGTVLLRFGKFGFFVVCIWGLFLPWSEYFKQNGRECQLHKDTLARMETDPDWWRKRDEEQRKHEKDTEDLQKVLPGYDPHFWDKSLVESKTAIRDLTRQIRGTKRAVPPR